jgi:uncharacterized protein (DUF885 family)
MGDTFQQLVDTYVREHFADHPGAATFQGFDGFDNRSPDLSADAIAAREAREDQWLERFSSVDDATVSPADRIDRNLVRSTLRGRQVRRELPEWARSPDFYLSPALMGVFSLFLRRRLPLPELVEAATARLCAVPALLNAGRTNLDPEMVPPVFITRALGQCRAGEVYARDLVPGEVDNDPSAQAQLAEAGEIAADAFVAFADHLTTLAETASGDWAIGEPMYTALLQEVELLGFGTGELQRRGEAAWADLDDEMAGLARIVDPDSPSWRDAVAACGEYRPSTPEEMRAAYEDETARTRAFLAERDLVTFPDNERCDVVPSPPFQRPVLAVASYFQPPAFGDSRVGRFNVPYPPEGTSDDEVARRLADNGFHSIPSITAHEAYPGHHWHLTTMLDASTVRNVHRSPYFAEGWALYAEKVMREHGYFTDPRDELLHLNHRIFRAARIVVDTALHSGDMTFDEAVSHMQDRAGLTEPVAKVEVGRYCAWPTQASAYLTGCLEIERLRTRWFDEDRGGLREFHDTLAASGCLPLALAERSVFG